MRIFITGPSKSGKTTLGQELAKTLNHVYLDPCSTLVRMINKKELCFKKNIQRTLSQGEGISKADAYQLLCDYSNSDYVNYHGFVMELKEHELNSETKQSFEELVHKDPTQTFLIQLCMDCKDVQERNEQLWIDPTTNAIYTELQVRFTKRIQLKKKENGFMNEHGEKEADTESKLDELNTTELEEERKSEGEESEKGNEAEEDEVDQDEELKGKDLATMITKMKDGPDQPVPINLTKKPPYSLIPDQILERLLPFSSPISPHETEPNASSSSTNHCFLSALIPKYLQLQLDATCHPLILLEKIRTYLLLQRCFQPTVLAFPYSETDVSALLSNARVESINSPYSLSKFGTLCPVSLFDDPSQKKQGSAKFAVGYRNYVYLTFSHSHQQRFLSNPVKYLNPYAHNHGLTFTILESIPRKESKLTSLLSEYYHLPSVSPLEYLEQNFNHAPHIKDPYLRQALPVLRSGELLPESLLVKAMVSHAHHSFQKKGGWIWHGFPCTLSEAQLLFEANQLPSFIIVSHSLNSTSSDRAQPDSFTSLLDFLKHTPTKVIIMKPEDTIPKLFKQIRELIDPCSSKAEIGSKSDLEWGNTQEYCPVTLHDKKILKKGSSQCAATFLGKLYYFESEKALSSFVEDPMNYIQLPEFPPPRFFFLGPSGAGMSTISTILENKYNLISVTASEFLRKLHQKDKAWQDIDSESTLPPAFMDKLMNILLYEPPYATQGFILKGFPRTRDEIQSLLQQGWFVDAFVFFKAEPNVLMDRLLPLYLKDNPHLDALKEEQSEEDNPIETLRQDILTNIEKEIASNDEIFQAITQTDMFYFEIDASKCVRSVAYTICQQLAPFLDYRKDLFQKVSKVSKERAEALLKYGFKNHSKFGYICPVTLERKKIISESTLGTFPAILGENIYWFRSKKKLYEFRLQPSRYLKSSHLLPYLPNVILVQGPPLSGKTLLAEKLGLELGLPYVYFPKVLEMILDDLPSHLSHLCFQLKNGGSLSTETASQILQWLLLRFPFGSVLDGITFPLSQVPNLIVQCDLPFHTLCSRLHPLMTSKSILKTYWESYQSTILPALQQWQSQYDVVLPIQAQLSKWYLKTQVCQVALLRLTKLSSFHHAIVHHMPISAYQVGLHKFQTVQSATKEYCPVSLHLGLRDVVPPTWEFSCFYKGIVYHCCSKEHLDLFIDEPLLYLNETYPSKLPERIPSEKVAASFPEQVEFQGYCPVTLSETEKCVDGCCTCALRFDGRLYFLKNEEAVLKFFRKPDTYASFVPKFKLPIRGPLIPLALLPPSDYLSRTLSSLLTPILHRLGKLRPVLPFVSLSQSAIIYLALSLNAENPNFKDYRRKHWVQLRNRFLDRADLLPWLIQEMRKPTLTSTKTNDGVHMHSIAFHDQLNRFFSAAS